MLNIGENFLNYKVLSRIGTGGMGEVFLARDTNLGRKVAIKILRKKYGQDKEGLRRFIQEAKTSSALNHPNIITIYEIGEYEDSNYISSEYIEGKTLHARLGKEPMQLNEILRIAMQVVEAISAAHAAGIIHRDIKPENVMVRADGYVKVLDFGLAKLTEQNNYSGEFDNESETMVETNPGMILGTVAYMSPEQARGREIDSRSDIWSVGVVLYEMITGIRPFTGETTSDVLAAILRSHPPDMEPYGVPIELEHIVSKALRKDRDERYQNIRDMLIDLKDLARELDLESRSGRVSLRNTGGRGLAPSTAEISQQPVSTAEVLGPATHSISDLVISQFRLHPKGMTASVAMLIVALASGVVGFKLWYDRPAAAHSFEKMKLSKLTSIGNVNPGTVAVSPDGKYIAYSAKQAGKESLWVRHVATSGNVEIVPEASGDYIGLTFTPDGNHVYFVEKINDGSRVVRVPVLGGEQRKVAEDSSGPVTFSPDGKSFAYVRKDDAMIIADADGGNSKTLAVPADGNFWVYSAWSPDGKRIVTTEISPSDSKSRLKAINVEDGTIETIASPPWTAVRGIAWRNDGSELLVTARNEEVPQQQIWSVSYPDGAIARVTNDLGIYIGLSGTADGANILSIQMSRKSGLWLAKPAAKDGVPIVSADETGAGLSGISTFSDGRVVYTARSLGATDIWVSDAAGKSKRQLTFDSRNNFWPSVSTDGKRIVFSSNRTGRLNIWQMDADGGNQIAVTDSLGIDEKPSFTPDGKWIVFQRVEVSGKTTIWKVPSAGGEPIQLTTVLSKSPAVSPDGKYVACSYWPGGSGTPPKVALIPIDGGQPERLLDLRSVAASPKFEWSADGRGFVYLDMLSTHGAVRLQALNGGSPAALGESDDEQIYHFDYQPNGNGIVIARGNDTSDAVMISNYR